jgi:hypothetical protein
VQAQLRKRSLSKSLRESYRLHFKLLEKQEQGVLARQRAFLLSQGVLDVEAEEPALGNLKAGQETKADQDGSAGPLFQRGKALPATSNGSAQK